MHAHAGRLAVAGCGLLRLAPRNQLAALLCCCAHRAAVSSRMPRPTSRQASLSHLLPHDPMSSPVSVCVYVRVCPPCFPCVPTMLSLCARLASPVCRGQELRSPMSHKSYRPLTVLSFRLQHLISTKLLSGGEGREQGRAGVPHSWLGHSSTCPALPGPALPWPACTACRQRVGRSPGGVQSVRLLSSTALTEARHRTHADHEGVQAESCINICFSIHLMPTTPMPCPCLQASRSPHAASGRRRGRGGGRATAGSTPCPSTSAMYWHMRA